MVNQIVVKVLVINLGVIKPKLFSSQIPTHSCFLLGRNKNINSLIDSLTVHYKDSYISVTNEAYLLTSHRE